MVRIPQSWARAGFAGLSGSGPARDPWIRPILRPPDHFYTRYVTVDLGNDGMAPSAIFTATGATASVGPSSGGDVWSLDQCFVGTSIGPFDGAQCTVFNGPLALPQYQITGSLSGGQSQFGLGGVAVPFGWFIWAVWTPGTVGAIGTLRLTGTKTVLSN